MKMTSQDPGRGAACILPRNPAILASNRCSLSSYDREREHFERDGLSLVNELYGSALRLTRQHEAAEDLVAETYARAWKSLFQYQTGTNLRAWLYKIMSNLFINTYRRRRREPLLVELDRREDTETGEGGDLYDKMTDASGGLAEEPSKILENRFLAKDIKQAVDRLPEEFREVMVLVDIQNFAYQETAEMLGIPIGTVRSRLWRARRFLQKLLWITAAGTI